MMYDETVRLKQAKRQFAFLTPIEGMIVKIWLPIDWLLIHLNLSSLDYQRVSKIWTGHNFSYKQYSLGFTEVTYHYFHLPLPRFILPIDWLVVWTFYYDYYILNTSMYT
jgi:hypothetical protein